MVHLNKFLLEHSDFKVVSSLTEEDQEKVRWADAEGYARIELAPGNVEVVSIPQIEKARMWWEKLHS